MSLVVQQTKAEPSLVEALKHHAAEKGTRLQAVYAEALQQFLQARVGRAAEGLPVRYLASPANGKTYNMKLPAALVRIAGEASATDATSARRLYYTALVDYAQRHDLLGPTPRRRRSKARPKG